jgi:hypothetical protein
MIQLTSKQITFIKTLQEIFKKYMGDLQKGDKFIADRPYQDDVRICHDISNEDNPITFDGLRIIEWDMKRCLLYPDVYPRDESQPQRSLIGMLGDDLRGFRRINGNQWVVETYDKKPESQVEPFVDDTIELALIQAILWKEGLYDKHFQKRQDD